MQDFTPQWLQIVLGIGFVAAAMSTVDTCGNVVALSASYDLLEPLLRKRQLSERQMETVARWMSVGGILAAYVYALFTDSLWDIFYLSSGVLTTTVFLPVIGSFRAATTRRQVSLSAVAGFTATLVFYYLESHGFLAALRPASIGSDPIIYIVFGFLASAIGFWAGAWHREQPPTVS